MAEPRVDEVVGAARRVPDPWPDVPGHAALAWTAIDITADDLDPLLDGADAVVQLSWLFQPTHRPDVTWRNNVAGTERLLTSLRRCAVPALVCSSSIAAYSPRTGLGAVGEAWPTHGASTAAYAREKAYVERLLDVFEATVPSCRVVRIRPAFVFQREAAVQQRRLFGGPLVPGTLLRPELIPVLPVPRGLRVQAVHSDDVAAAITATVTRPVTGAFNIAADGVLDAKALGRLFQARVAPVSPRLVRGLLGGAWRAHLSPAPADLFDALLNLPTMSTTKARRELNWAPSFTAADAVEQFLIGIREGTGGPTPALAAGTSGVLRLREWRSGVGTRP